MDSTALHDLFRSEVRDEATPYLWSDAEIYSYIDDAQKMFCRLQGGIADASSAITRIDVMAGDVLVPISPLIVILKSRVRLYALCVRRFTVISIASAYSATASGL